jgi:hypothetical protein
LALIKSIDEEWSNKNNWWNKLQTMSQDDVEVLPNEYVKKFGSFIIRFKENQLVARLDDNLNSDMYSQVKHLDHLYTNEEIEAIEAKKAKQREADTGYQYTLDNYMKR